MDTVSKSPSLPPAYDATNYPSSTSDILDPATLILSGTSISGTTSTQLYQLSRNILNLPPSKNVSSILFARVEPSPPVPSLKNPYPAAPIQDPTHHHHQPLFYLAHPLHAKYRTDLPAYYLTSLSPSMLGNIRLKASKSQSRLQRTEFTALLSAGRSARSSPLFDEVGAMEGEEKVIEGGALLFSARGKLKWRGGGGCKWMDGQGKEVAVEVDEREREREGENRQYKLIVTVPMRRDMRDALVAMWLLRLWYARAENGRVRREAMEALMPAEGYYSDMKLAKRTGALGAVSGASC